MSVKFWNRASCVISPKAEIGDGSIVHAFVVMHDHVIVGKKCKIQVGAFLPDGVALEDEVVVGPHVCFTNHRDPRLPFNKIDYTLVKKGAFIGANSTILAGVIVGEGAIIGMGSVVTKDVPAGELWFGNPAEPHPRLTDHPGASYV